MYSFYVLMTLRFPTFLPAQPSSRLAGRSLVAILVGVTGCLGACCSAGHDDAAPAAPALVTFTAPGLFPEGMQYDATK